MKLLIYVILFSILNCKSMAFSKIIPANTNRKLSLKPLRFSSGDIVTSLAVNTAVATTAHFKRQKSLTQSGLINAWILGNILLTCGGFQAWTTCALYFLIGNVATKVKMTEKEKAGIAENRGGMRGPENVWGSAATAAIFCSLIGHGGNDDLLKLGFMASLATKASDTSASEIGKAFGKNCYRLTDLSKVPPGTEGGVSIEGTIAGIIGSILISIYGKEIGWISDWNQLGIVILSSFIATTIESFLGATIQNNKLITNEFINFINTMIGSLVSILLENLKNN